MTMPSLHLPEDTLPVYRIAEAEQSFILDFLQGFVVAMLVFKKKSQDTSARRAEGAKRPHRQRHTAHGGECVQDRLRGDGDGQR